MKLTRSLAFLGCASFAALYACSFIVDADTAQCATTADCVAKGSAFVGTVCSDRGVCQLQGGCSTNADCIDANGGQPFICKKSTRTCVSLVQSGDQPGSPKCTPYADKDDIRNDNTIWIGNVAMPNDKSSGYVSQEHLPDLARQEFKSGIGSLPGIGAGAPGRPIGIEFCDAISATDFASATSGAKFLVEEVGIKAMIGPPGHVVPTMFPQILKPAQVLSFPNSAGEQAAIDSEQPRLLYTHFPDSIDGEARTVANVLKNVEPLIRERAELGSAPIRVAVVNRKDAYNDPSFTAALKYLTFNGKLAVENGDNFLVVSYNENPTQAELAAAQAKVAAFKPHYIYGLGQAEFARSLMGPIENQLPADAFRPIWMIRPTIATQDMLTMVNAPEHRKTELGRRFTYMNGNWAKYNPKIAAANLNYQNRFPNDPPIPDLQSLGFLFIDYDLFYYIAYLVAANGASPLTGPNLAKAMSRIQDPSGLAIETGPEQLYTGISALTSGRNIKISGLTPITYDPVTGQPNYPQLHVWCGIVNEAGFTNGVKPDAELDLSDGWALKTNWGCLNKTGTEGDAGADGG